MVPLILLRFFRSAPHLSYQEIPPMGVFKSIPRIVKVGTRLCVEDFVASPQAYNYKDYEGKTATLYIVETGGFLKIGLSTEFERRFRSLDFSTPFPLRKVCIRTVPLAGLVYAEAWLHDHFKDRRIKGEWFAIGEAEALIAVKKAVKRAEVYADACQEWYAADLQRRSTPEYLAKARIEYKKSLGVEPAW